MDYRCCGFVSRRSQGCIADALLSCTSAFSSRLILGEKAVRSVKEPEGTQYITVTDIGLVLRCLFHNIDMDFHLILAYHTSNCTTAPPSPTQGVLDTGHSV